MDLWNSVLKHTCVSTTPLEFCFWSRHEVEDERRGSNGLSHSQCDLGEAPRRPGPNHLSSKLQIATPTSMEGTLTTVPTTRHFVEQGDMSQWKRHFKFYFFKMRLFMTFFKQWNRVREMEGNGTACRPCLQPQGLVPWLTRRPPNSPAALWATDSLFPQVLPRLPPPQRVGLTQTPLPGRGPRQQLGATLPGTSSSLVLLVTFICMGIYYGIY